MKKNMKSLLFGLGTIATGYIAYKIYKQRKLESEIKLHNTKICKPKPDTKEHLDKNRAIKRPHEKELVKSSESNSLKEINPGTVGTNHQNDITISVNREEKQESIERNPKKSIHEIQ